MGKIIYNKGFKDLILKKSLAPTITFIEKDTFSITVTFTNNSSSEATISYGLSSPPNDDTVVLGAGQTSSNIVFSGLQGDTTFNIFASSNETPENLVESDIVSIEVTTDVDPFAIFFDTSGSPGSPTPINDLDGNIMADLGKGIAYYGTVSHTDLYTADEFSSEFGITEGEGSSNSSIQNQAEWHKYYWNGGIHFRRIPIRASVKHNTLWMAGLVYGTGTATSRKGYSPINFDSFDNNTATGVIQNAEITKNGITYIVRLLEAAKEEPGVDTTSEHNSEHNLINMNLHAATNPGFYDGSTSGGTSTTDGVTYNNWFNPANWTNDDFVGWKTNLGDNTFFGNSVGGNGSQWSQETFRESSSLNIRRFSKMFNRMNETSFNGSSSNQPWAPILTVKHPSFATYGKTGGFNQNEPDW